MTKQEIKKIANALIEENSLPEAIEVLSGYVKGIDENIESNLLLQTVTFNENEQDFEKLFISRHDYYTTWIKVHSTLRRITEDLPDKGNEVEVSKRNQSKRSLNGVDVKRKILFLAASPKSEVHLNLGKESRKIKDTLAKAGTQFEIESEFAVTTLTIAEAMQATKPEIVHFAGHGAGEQGLVVEDDVGNAVFFSTERLNRLFQLFRKNVKCVVLNAAYSREQAKVISKHGIYVIGLKDPVTDEDSRNFAIGFYQGLGAGKDYKLSYEMGLINMVDSEYTDAYELWHNGKKLDL